MNANSLFSYTRNYPFTPDWSSLSACYQPIIGLEAMAVYQSLITVVELNSEVQPLHELLGRVEQPLEKVLLAFDCLSALSLMELYQLEEGYIILLQPPLSIDAFLGNPLYKALLETYIGELAVSRLRRFHLPAHAQSLSKTFADVFDDKGQVKEVSLVSSSFDVGHFKQQMSRDNLRFADEQADTIALYRMAEQQKWTWFEAYQVAKETALGQVISTKRMRQKIQALAQPEPSLSRPETALLAQCKGQVPLAFLTKIKQSKKAAVTQSERQCLIQLAELGLLDEVINVLLSYTFAKVDSGNLNEKYILKVANDMSYQGIVSAEQAIAALRNKRSTKETTAKPVVNNVPEWSKKEVNTQQTAEGQARLEAIRQRMLENEQKGR